MMQWLAGKIWDEGMLFIPQNSVSNAKVFLISCAIGWGVWGIVTIIRRFKRTKALKKARGKDIAHRAEYDRKKKIADIEIKEQRDALAVEVANKINDIQAVIQKIKSSVKDQKKVLESIPGLAMQDKNLYTVNILITYFERGKVDSLKEAINLFDSEEREKARAAIERATQMQIELAQELALDQMQKEQQEHNEKIRQQIDKYGKEIDALIDEMKYKN